MIYSLNNHLIKLNNLLVQRMAPWLSNRGDKLKKHKEKLTVTKESVSNQNVMATYYSILGNGRESQDMFSIEPGSSPYLWV